MEEEEVARVALTKYEQLPKKGKPNEQEHSCLAAIVMATSTSKGQCSMQTVAIGTGSKCLGQVNMDPKGEKIHDSHAEIIARKAFLRCGTFCFR